MPELEFSDLTVKVGTRTLLDRIQLRLEPGEFVALIGPNGSGKTTLLKTALALRPGSSGSVRVGGQLVAQLSARERAAHIAWLPQHIRADEPITGLETVAAARFRFRESRTASRGAAERALERVGATSYANRAMTELSGGERQRVGFACLVAQEARVLLFDEPANHLDPAQQLEVYRLLGELWREGRTILCITHDVNLLHRLGDGARLRVTGLRSGKLCFDSAWTDSALPDRLGSLFDIEMDAIEARGQRLIVPRPRRDP